MTALRHVDATKAVVAIPKGRRMEWTDAMARDTEVSHGGFRVASIIGAHFNHATGSTFIGLERIARLTGMCRNTVRKFIKELEELGYLIVERPEIAVRHGQRFYGGRGATNIYRPSFRHSDGPENGAVLEQHQRKRGQHGEPFSVEKGCNAVSPSLVERGQIEGKKGSSAADPVPLLTQEEALALEGDDWAKVRSLLERTIDPVEVRCWFRDIWLEQQGSTTITLATTRPFTRKEVEARYGSALLLCWQSLYPSVERIEIGLRPRKPMEAPQ
jgi:Helix-turn-helix domain